MRRFGTGQSAFDLFVQGRQTFTQHLKLRMLGTLHRHHHPDGQHGNAGQYCSGGPGHNAIDALADRVRLCHLKSWLTLRLGTMTARLLGRTWAPFLSVQLQFLRKSPVSVQTCFVAL